ncbi:murein hydrolase activator EnvC family protein [Paraferrimonas haliotis]|uniref:Non-catalytic member of peptidase subfamily M23B n=1 Tax=Paraferrimonas haliotis TaxID=2013866 RepID=A0AA37TIP6_9GAMM|nr:peptidoglycan DD-metalloendopeptidase family protein [Paraferrimonas haliotis]GLS82034.1 non-catalytic member of peptidase subfamily M23B [Paraferrimonas haliotis]
MIQGRLHLLIVLLVGLMAQGANANDLEKRKAELSQLQQQISQQTRSLKRSQAQIDKLHDLLAKDERAIADAARNLANTEASLKKVGNDISKTAARIQQLETLQKGQQQILAKQIASAYYSGTHDYTKMLLNQEDPALIERMLVYYQYLNKARARSLQQLKITTDELAATQEKATKQQQQLLSLRSQQTQQQQSLTAEKKQRQETAATLNRSLASEGRRLEQLQIEEANLKHVIEQAIAASKKDKELTGLNVRNSKLSWPTRGRIVRNFGSPRSGNIRWNGVTISAAEGRSVKAIANGKVLYANWMKGYGMVMVVDHGGGYMSLYGHAQTLFNKVGDRVNKGDTIALVGKSGGSANSGLYFELRKKGKPVNPRNYCK